MLCDLFFFFFFSFGSFNDMHEFFLTEFLLIIFFIHFIDFLYLVQTSYIDIFTTLTSICVEEERKKAMPLLLSENVENPPEKEKNISSS